MPSDYIPMDEDVVERILLLNRSFYSEFAETFADSRLHPQPGFRRLLDLLRPSTDCVLDVGCGNGRFGAFLKEQGYTFRYTGVDFSRELLTLAERNVGGRFFQRDVSHSGYLQSVGRFDLVVCLSTLQHIPGRRNRINMLLEMKEHLAARGRIFLANWQFLDSERQRRKIRRWPEVDLSEEEVEDNDYLVSWQREGSGLRYVCYIDAEETAALAAACELRIIDQFRSDGREGNLNLYTVMTHPPE